MAATAGPETMNADTAPELPVSEPELSIEEVVTRPIVESIVANASPDYELLDFTAKLGTRAGDNFMSIMYAVTIQVKSRRTGGRTQLHIMLKTIPRNAMRVQMINECQAFVKEARMYDTVFPELVQYQKEQGLSEEDLYSPLPRCYGSLNDGKTDYIAMQDLRNEQFKMGDRHGGLGLDESLLVVRSLAKFHAVSFAKYKGDYSALMTKFPYLQERMFLSPEKMPEMQKQFSANCIKMEAALLRDASVENEAEAVALENFYGENEEYFEKLHLLVGAPVPKAVIGHGDCWTNNFLFKYDPESGKPTEVKFLDFQLSRICSRAIDLAYFLYTSPNQGILNNQEEVLLRAYYDQFEAFLQLLGLSETGGSWEDFKEEFNKFRPYGLAMGFLIAPIISAQSGDIPDLETMPEEFSENSAEEFIGGSMKSKATYVKILNFAKNHLPKIKNYF